MKRVLLIDGQILQTNAWHRGMGKYIVQVLNKLNNYVDSNLSIAIVFNSGLICDEARFEAIRFLCPDIEQYQVDLPFALDKSSDSKNYIGRLDEFISDNFAGKEIIYMITSLFLFEFYSEFPTRARKLLMFYDLTPLHFWQDLGGYFPPDLYMTRFQQIYEAEQIYAISETTRQDLLKIFGLPSKSVVNINGGFTKIAEMAKKPKGLEVPEKYILFPTGSLPHKNNEVAVRGFDAFCRESKSNMRLLITSSFSDEEKQKLKSIRQDIIFSDNVSDEELEWLYEHADMVLFASKYEGLGLPILDAVASDKVVITSRISVFEEMSKQAFYYFDPSSEKDLSEALSNASNRKNFLAMQQHYAEIIRKYTWQNTTDSIMESISNLQKNNKIQLNSDRPRVAVVSLQPGIKGGQIGRLAETLYFRLRQLYKVDFYLDGNAYFFRNMERPTYLDYLDCKVFDISKLDVANYRSYESVIYLIDKFALPSRAAQRAAVLPGIVMAGNLSNIDDQAKMFKDIVLDNQYYVNYLDISKAIDYKSLTAKIAKQIASGPAESRKEPALLKARGGTRSIISKLKALHDE